MTSFISNKLAKQQLDTAILKNVKGGGWGNGEKADMKNCPPPFDPNGKHSDRIG